MNTSLIDFRIIIPLKCYLNVVSLLKYYIHNVISLLNRFKFFFYFIYKF